MNKLMKKKVNMFGKEFSVFTIAIISMMVLATAALIPYFGLITGHVTVTQGLLVDGLSVATGSGSIQDSYNDFTSLQSPTYVRMHNLTNNANVQANGVLNTDCGTLNKSDDCSNVDYRDVEYFDNAGANFSGYNVNSSLCTVNVTSGNLIQTAIDNASAGNVVCVKAGTYNENLTINKSITLVALNSPNSTDNTTIIGGVTLESNSTLKGFVINSGRLSSGAKVGVSIYFSNTKVSDNIIEGINFPIGSNATHGIHVYNSGSNILISNNLIENVNNTNNGGSYGIMVQANSDNVKILHNTITNISGKWVGGVSASPSGSSGITGLPDGLNISGNEFENLTGNTYPAVGFYIDSLSGALSDGTSDLVVDASQVTFENNNIENSVAYDLGNKDTGHTLNAKNNWYGTNGLSTFGDVNATWMTKTNFSIAPHGVDKFAILASFPKMLYPDTYTVNTTVTA